MEVTDYEASRGEGIRSFILGNVRANPRTISKLTAKHFSLTRQAVNHHLRRLVEEGALNEKGKTRNRTYALVPLLEWRQTYAITADLAEDVAWRNDVDQVLGTLPENVRDIWLHGFTEMFNNAKDHSGGTTIWVEAKKTAVSTEMTIADDGVGIFRKIQRELRLLDGRHAIFELSKGKLTTDPEFHTGEGIFFTSRMFDAFDILSGGLFFTHTWGDDEDWLIERPRRKDGTAVFMNLGNHTSRTTRQVFDRYTGSDDDYGFNKTVVPVRLAQYGNDKLIARSQAKRVLARVELFKAVILDFTHVPTIGRAFADEVFRIFPRDHPGVALSALRMNADVRRMVDSVRAKEPCPTAEPSEDDLDWQDEFDGDEVHERSSGQ